MNILLSKSAISFSATLYFLLTYYVSASVDLKEDEVKNPSLKRPLTSIMYEISEQGSPNKIARQDSDRLSSSKKSRKTASTFHKQTKVSSAEEAVEKARQRIVEKILESGIQLSEEEAHNLDFLEDLMKTLIKEKKSGSSAPTTPSSRNTKHDYETKYKKNQEVAVSQSQANDQIFESNDNTRSAEQPTTPTLALASRITPNIAIKSVPTNISFPTTSHVSVIRSSTTTEIVNGRLVYGDFSHYSSTSNSQTSTFSQSFGAIKQTSSGYESKGLVNTGTVTPHQLSSAIQDGQTQFQSMMYAPGRQGFMNALSAASTPLLGSAPITFEGLMKVEEESMKKLKTFLSEF